MDYKTTYLRITPHGHGCFMIIMEYRGNHISGITNNTEAVDDYRCDPSERDGRVLRKKRGFERLAQECISRYNRIN